MGIQVTLVYSIAPEGLTAAQIAALVTATAAPLPADILAGLGCIVASDITLPGPPVTRTIVLSFLPSVTSLAHSVLFGGDPTGSPLEAIVIDAPGAVYVKPPRVDLTINPNLLREGLPQAFLQIAAVTSLVGGAGYSASTRAVVTTPTATGRRPAVLTPTIAAGVVTALAITDPGDGFEDVAQVIFVDPVSPPGTGASATLSMNVSPNVRLNDPGKGYNPAPTVTMTPWFKTMFPDGTDQKKPFWDLFTGTIAKACLSPVTAAPPVVA